MFLQVRGTTFERIPALARLLLMLALCPFGRLALPVLNLWNFTHCELHTSNQSFENADVDLQTDVAVGWNRRGYRAKRCSLPVQ